MSTIRTEIGAWHIKRYVITCFQIQRQIILFIFLVTYLAYILFLSYVAIFHLLRRREGFGIYYNFISD